MDEESFNSNPLKEYDFITDKIKSDEITTSAQLSIHCTLLDLDIEKVSEFIIWNALTLTSLKMLNFVFRIIRTSDLFDGCLNKTVIEKMIAYNCMNLFDEEDVYKTVTINTLKVLLDMDKRNPIILLRYFLSFEKTDVISLKTETAFNSFFNLFYVIIERCEKRSEKMEKLKNINLRLKNVLDKVHRFNTIIR